MNNIRIFSARLYAVALLILLTGCGKQDSKNIIRGSKGVVAGVPVKGVKQTTLEEAALCKDFYSEKKDYDLVSKYIEHMLTLTKGHAAKGELILELADTYMKMGNREKARNRYGEYKTLFPGSKKIKYVMYQELIAHDADTLDYMRDQTKTRETLALAQAFLKEFPHDPDHSNQVEKIINKSYITLAQHELGIAQFYLMKYERDSSISSLKAAQRRLTHIMESYVPRLDPEHNLHDIVITLNHDKPETTYQMLQQAADRVEAFVAYRDNLRKNPEGLPQPNPIRTGRLKSSANFGRYFAQPERV